MLFPVNAMMLDGIIGNFQDGIWKSVKRILIALMIPASFVLIFLLYYGSRYGLSSLLDISLPAYFKDYKEETMQSPVESGIYKTITSEKIKFDGLFDSGKECFLSIDPSSMKAPFKIYVYDMTSFFNRDQVECLYKYPRQYQGCYKFSDCGMGPEIYRINGVKMDINQDQLCDFSVRETHMFSLEVIIHYKLLSSPYRTLKPEEADAFYVPVYFGLHYMCDYYPQGSGTWMLQHLFSFLTHQPYFNKGLLHFTTFGRTLHDLHSDVIPVIQNYHANSLVFMSIEDEFEPNWIDFIKIHDIRSFTLPYPSYVHLISCYSTNSNQTSFNQRNDTTSRINRGTERNVFVLLAMGQRELTPLRERLESQFRIQTDESHEEYFNKRPVGAKEDMVLLHTNPCVEPVIHITTRWLTNSVFCLQPGGLTPSRKSVYDSIQSGCIPVLFKDSRPIILAFPDKIPYKDFTVTIPEEHVVTNTTSVLSYLKAISRTRIVQMQLNMRRVQKFLQYSVMDGVVRTEHDDAVKLILEEIGYILTINNVTRNKQ
ncbi:hypothetical protein CHS0354_023193 [Potamilus streckersoni]|uniref:Exostosin GT47 domain-containing protein n=1 Tax=Potamilus streckersoni TaxID=2493646 RepID=A0AAE0SJ64_9BIVA|nr:hypothetical protein CHS0354_023193 [Potamilus streckersoni]